MSRIKDLQKQVHRVLDKMDDSDKRAKAVAHLHGVSLASVMIAKRREENAELAAMAGLLHDLHAYKSGSYDDHATSARITPENSWRSWSSQRRKRRTSSVRLSGIMTTKPKLTRPWMKSSRMRT